MSAKDDYPLRRHGWVDEGGWIIQNATYKAMCDEIDKHRRALKRFDNYKKNGYCQAWVKRIDTTRNDDENTDSTGR